MDGLTLSQPDGAFYGSIGCAGLIGRGAPGGALLDDAAVATHLLREARVASVRGAAFGPSPHVRISTATGDEVLAEAVARITAAVAQTVPARRIPAAAETACLTASSGCASACVAPGGPRS